VNRSGKLPVAVAILPSRPRPALIEFPFRFMHDIGLAAKRTSEVSSLEGAERRRYATR
jgi:hypothetical protein